MADKKNKNRKNLWEKIKNNPFPVIFIISLIAFIFKYKGFPRADANAQLVGIYHAANPEYFKNDFYANSFSSFDVTTSFTKLVNLVNTPINNYEITYMLLLFASMFVFSIGFYKIVFLLTKNRELSLFSIILPLSVYTMRIGIGNTFEIGNCLIPANIAWAIAIWPLYFYLKEKYSLSFFLLGLASIFHVLIGILLFGAFFFNLLLNKKYKSIFSSLYFFILFAVTAIPLFISNAKTSSQDPAKIISALGFRSPWHYLPSTWPLPDWITFFSFFIFFLIIFYKFSKIDKEYKKIFEGFLIIILVYYLIGTIFVELIPLKFIIKLQLFRITELLNIIELIFVGIFFYNYIYKKFPKKQQGRLARRANLNLATFCVSNHVEAGYKPARKASSVKLSIKADQNLPAVKILAREYPEQRNDLRHNQRRGNPFSRDVADKHAHPLIVDYQNIFASHTPAHPHYHYLPALQISFFIQIHDPYPEFLCKRRAGFDRPRVRRHNQPRKFGEVFPQQWLGR